MYTSESQGILFQLRDGFAGKIGKPFKGKNILTEHFERFRAQVLSPTKKLLQCLQTSLVKGVHLRNFIDQSVSVLLSGTNRS